MNHPAPDTASTRIQAALAQQDWALMVKLCKQALRKQGRHHQAHRGLGFALNKTKKTQEAHKAYQQAAAFFPQDAELLINYGNFLIEHALHQDALPMLKKVCELRPQQAITWIKLAQCCYQLGLCDQGFDAALKAEPLASNLGEQVAVLTQKAIHRRELGQVKEAIADCVQAIALCPQDTANHTNRLLFMLADPDATAEQLHTAAKEYGEIVEAPLRPYWPSFAERQEGGPWRKLKVGFLSPDFRTHSVMYFTEGILAQLDRRQFEVFAFYLFPRDDQVTRRVQNHADYFVRLSGMTHEEQAQAIRAQGIDILIDLAGHTGSNGLQAMARRAAPIQISWLGYPATTGLQSLDYKISDEVTDPPGAENQYTEHLCRLPVFFTCYRPMSRNPLWRYQPRYLVQPTPALAQGHITFGSCNNLGKLTPQVLALWGRLLQRVPNARLLIEGKDLDKPNFAAQYRQKCADAGIDTSRLDLVPLDTNHQYLTYHRIDIALDPWPLTGGTTTFDVLWMGVPLVSMVGSIFKSRMTTGILTYLGQTDWLAHDEEQYLHIAQTLAQDIPALDAIRQQLRGHLEQSSLMREDIFCHHYGHALRAMWVHWLAQQAHPNNPQAQAQLLDEWQTTTPEAWNTPDTPGVGLAPGQRCTLPQAHQRLEAALAKAKAAQPQAKSGTIEHRTWVELTELAETVLCAVPHDPVALACLAEVEMAHGHHDFAVTYLRYATAAMGAIA